MKALEPVIQFLAKEDSQASFRLSQSRSQLQVNEKPDHVNLWQFSQCLLAEAGTLSLFGISSKASSSTTSSPIKVKQLDGSATAKPAIKDDKIKGKGTSNVNKPCRYFASDAGCRAGNSCKMGSILGQHRGQEQQVLELWCQRSQKSGLPGEGFVWQACETK